MTIALSNAQPQMSPSTLLNRVTPDSGGGSARSPWADQQASMGALAKAPGPSRVDSPIANVEQRVDCCERVNGTLRRPAPVLSERQRISPG
jgi:hypothetical protein